MTCTFFHTEIKSVFLGQQWNYKTSSKNIKTVNNVFLVFFFINFSCYSYQIWRFRLKDLSIDEMVGAWYFGCCLGHRYLHVGFLMLRYSVLFTVESLSLLYLILISWFISSRRWCINTLGVFLMQTKQLYFLIHIWTKGDVGAPWPFQGGWSFMLFLFCFCYALVCVCLLMPSGHLLGKGWPLGSCLWCLIVKLSLSHWYPGSAVVLDCIDSWSLPFILLSFISSHILFKQFLV